MKLRYKISLGVVGVIAVLITTLAITLGYTKSCPTPPATTVEGASMKAVRYYCYGAPEILSYSDVERPQPAPDEVLVRVAAAAVNPLDWHFMRGSPYFMRLFAGIGAPGDSRLGVDFAGTVEATGSSVSRFKPGDAVFGGTKGAFAEYLVIREDRAIAPKPDNVSFEEAAGVPIAAITALQALRDQGQLRAGERVLINGASGGVGSYAVQIASAMGAHVTGVCSARNAGMVRSLGADEVIDYRQQDYTRNGEQFDLIVDMVGNHSPLENRRALTPTGRLVIVGGPAGDWLGPMLGPLQAALYSPFVDQKLSAFTARMLPADLATLADYLAEGTLTTVIDRRFPLPETADAIRYSESGRARGKIIIQVEE